MSALRALDSFAGGFAKGIDMGTRMRAVADENARQEEDQKNKRDDRAKSDAIESELSAIQPGPVYKGSNFKDEGFASSDEALAARQPQHVQSDAASTQAAMGGGAMPAPAPQTDPQAPLPDKPAAAMPPQQGQASQANMVTVQDPITRRYHNVDPGEVREPGALDLAKARAAVYFKHGKADEGYKIISEAAQARASEINVNREELTDALARNIGNPEGAAKVANDMFGDYGTNFQVHPVTIPTGEGKTETVFALNQTGTNAPPMFLDVVNGDVQLTTEPSPGMYGRQMKMLIGMAHGDLTGQIAQMVATQATIEGIASTRQNRQQSAAEFPLDMEAKRTGIAATRAGIANTQANTARTVQGIGIDADQNRRGEGEYRDTTTPGTQQGLTIEHNNNPGAMKWSPWQKAYGGRPDPNSEFTIYPNAQAGIRAQEALLSKNYVGKTVDQIVEQYAPAEENTPAQRANYKKKIAAALGIKIGDKVTADQVSELGAAMRGVETGKSQSGIPPRQVAVMAEKAQTRVAKIKDDALKIAAANSSNQPGSREFNNEVLTYMVSQMRGEPKEVQDAFKQQFGVNTSLMR